MDTKSKSDHSFIWSIIALIIALASIIYCFSVVIELLESRWEWSTRLLSSIFRIVKGGTA